MNPYFFSRKIFAFLGLIVITYNSYCQSPQTFPLSKHNPVWKQTDKYYNSIYNSSRCFSLHGDTLINDNLFQKLYIVGDTMYNDTIKTYRGAIRDEAGKIFIIYYDRELPSLLFDFTAKEGDTIWLKSVYLCRDFERYTEYVVVNSINSIEINGNIHRVFNVTDGFHDDNWIEGIGNDGEIFSPLTILTDDGFWGSEIACFKRDEKIYYPDSTSNCFRYTDIVEITSEENPFLVYPNPTGSFVMIKSDSFNRIVKVNLVNLCGSIVDTYNPGSEPEVKISLGKFSSGTYIIEITTDQNKCYYSKIIKH